MKPKYQNLGCRRVIRSPPTYPTPLTTSPLVSQLGNALAIPQPVATEIALDVAYGRADVEVESVVVCLQMITTSLLTALLGYWISAEAEYTSLR